MAGLFCSFGPRTAGNDCKSAAGVADNPTMRSEQGVPRGKEKVVRRFAFFPLASFAFSADDMAHARA